MHGGNAGVVGFARRGEAHRLAAKLNLSFVRAVQARHDFDQRRFTGAILAEERVNFSGAHVEVDIVQHLQSGEGLGYSSERNGGFGHCVTPPSTVFVDRARQ